MKNLKTEIKWAILFSLVMIAWMVLEKSLGWHDEKIADHAKLTSFFAIPAIAVYVFALMDKKKNDLGGFMSYKQGLATGLWITLFVAILSPLVQFIISQWITPDYFANVIAYSVSTGELTQEKAESYFNLKSYIIQSLIGAVLMGVITSLIVAFFVRSKSILKPS
ncbi:DUF4199 domain-containing protein [Algoriphagus hitonicola]|uniref:DUF4199 domain-containing protein n=1 Tax=Algoriphagus hitonicola TaxID=435880 RepID=A0A1I2UYQ2_9BACT|nr:DUF4199 domain-containing protein [Algoriphagus hitonicola]SFG80116.1 Protein of unknown function [Algoriphagus hitonicola]